MYRDHTQFYMRLDALVRKYKLYSKDALARALKKIAADIAKTFANNHVHGIEPHKKTYHDYLNSLPWNNKKESLVYPVGPYDQCVDCHKPLSISTAHVHHLTYARVGTELPTDLIPLCAECHAYRHPQRTGLKDDNKNAYVVLPGVTVTRLHDSGKSFYCLIQNQEYNIPYYVVDKKNSEVKGNIGDTGTLIITREMAIQKGLAK
jgi:5-methylcytosine-specific restriction endonuclease McrA